MYTHPCRQRASITRKKSMGLSLWLLKYHHYFAELSRFRALTSAFEPILASFHKQDPSTAMLHTTPRAAVCRRMGAYLPPAASGVEVLQ